MYTLIAALKRVVADLQSEGVDLLAFEGTDEDFDKLVAWLDQLNFTAGRAPAGGKKIVDDLKFLQRQLTFRSGGWSSLQKNNVKGTLSRWDEATIAFIVKKLAKKEEEPDTLELTHATYHNKSVLNFKGFQTKAKMIDKHLGTLKGFHAKALGGLNIYLVKKELTRAGATYKSNDDVIYIRPDKVSLGDNYGSFVYVITHELGHRYERKIRQKTDFESPEWYTTKYSKKDTLSGGEQFAELFALSHWPEKYKQYETKIEKFLEAITV